MKTDNLFDISGRVAIVTGGSRGIGRAIAERLAQHGAKVVVSSRKLPACEEVVAGIRERGGEAMAVQCNIGRKPELEALVEATKNAWGRIDILVCNAAINPHYGPSAGIPDEIFDKVMASNIKSNLWLSHMAAPHMMQVGGGSIIIISSVGGLRGSLMLGAYAISKAADMQLARNLAIELGSKNIRTNCIAPGLVKTDFARALWDNPAALARSSKVTPLKRIGEPDDIAGAAVFLAAPASGFMTGQTIVVDGGSTAGSAAASD